MTKASPSLHVHASDSVATKVDKLQRFLGERYFHPGGLMYAMWRFNGDEQRPFEDRDFDGMATFKIKAGTSMAALHNNENSPYIAGQFLWAQCLRYEATKDDEAMRFADKAFRSLDINFRLGEENGEAGFFCKPYDLKYSTETSPDQYTTIAQGLWEYRKYCDPATRRRVDQMIPAMSDWWRLRNYRLVYFDHEGDWLNGDGTYQYGPGYIILHLLALRVTGKPVYREEADRIFALCGSFKWRHDDCHERMVTQGECFWPERMHGAEYDPSRRKYLHLDWENYGAISYPAVACAWLIENDGTDADPSRKPLLQHALANYFRHIKQPLADDLLSLYWSQTDLETGKCYPLIRPRISNERKDRAVDFDWNFCTYASKIRWGDATARVADVALLAHRYAPAFSPGALALCRELYARLDNDRLKWFHDPDGKQLMPEDSWMNHVLSSETPAAMVLTYWRSKLWGIDLEKQPA